MKVSLTNKPHFIKIAEGVFLFLALWILPQCAANNITLNSKNNGKANELIDAEADKKCLEVWKKTKEYFGYFRSCL